MAKKKTAVKAKKSTTKAATPTAKSRRLKPGQYRSFRLSRRLKPMPRKPLPSAWRIFRTAVSHVRAHYRLFLGIVLVYGLLYVIFVQGIGSGLNLGELKTSLQEISKGSYAQLSNGLVLFGALLSSINNTTNEAAGVYQATLLVLVSLALTYALRQTWAKARIRIRDSFYHGMYPLIPYLLVIFVIGLQLLPLVIGSTLYGLVVNNQIAINTLERSVWALFYFLTALLSLYMVCSSLFALYIVTLPNMTPLKALRSARQLVLHRRFQVLRKLLFLPIVLIGAALVIFVPLILWLTPVAVWVFFGFAMISLALIHSYMYTLYREML